MRNIYIYILQSLDYSGKPVIYCGLLKQHEKERMEGGLGGRARASKERGGGMTEEEKGMKEKTTRRKESRDH